MKRILLFMLILFICTTIVHADDFLGSTVEDRDVPKSLLRFCSHKIVPVVTAVEHGSLAELLGFHKGDVVVKVDDTPVVRAAHLKDRISSANSLTVLRGAEQIILSLSSKPSLVLPLPAPPAAYSHSTAQPDATPDISGNNQAASKVKVWRTPEALQAFGKPGDSVKEREAVDEEQSAPVKRKISRNRRGVPVDTDGDSIQGKVAQVRSPSVAYAAPVPQPSRPPQPVATAPTMPESPPHPEAAAPALPESPDKADVGQNSKQAAEMMAEAIQKQDPELLKKAIEYQRQNKERRLRLVMLLLVVTLLITVSLWVIFVKAGHSGWKCLIPFYNVYILLEISGQPWWFFILFFIPLVGTVIYLLAMLGMAKKFGRGALFGVGLWLLPMFFFPVLAFGGSEYEG